MTTIRATCPSCGDVRLKASDVVVRVCANDNKGSYCFRCPSCGLRVTKSADSRIVDLLARHPEVRHVKVEDGPGRRLGRSFRVKLWPNLVFMKDGAVVKQLARPSAHEMREAMDAIA